MRILSALPLLSAAFVASCGGASSKEADPKPATAWKDMKHDERAAYMKNTVLPKMKVEFIAFDGKDGTKDKSFKMPNPKLPKLPATEEGFKKLSAEHPEAMTFMRTKVVPHMAALVGEAPYDPKTHEGFGCFECHLKKE